MVTGVYEHVFDDSGDFATSGAWTLNGNWNSGTAPLTGVEIVIKSPDFDIDTFPSPGTVNLGAITIASTVTKKIGTSGDRMDVDVTHTTNSAGVVLFQGQGQTNYFAGNANYFIVDHGVYRDTSLFIKHRDAAIGDVWIRSGSVTLDGGSYTRIVLNSTVGQSSRCVIDAGSTLVTVICTSGTILSSATDTITTLEIGENGRFDLLAVEAVTTLNMFGGQFYFDGLSTINEINQWGGTVDVSRTSGNRTITTYNGHGGRLIPPSGGGLSIVTRNFSPAFDSGGL